MTICNFHFVPFLNCDYSVPALPFCNGCIGADNIFYCLLDSEKIIFVLGKENCRPRCLGLLAHCSKGMGIWGVSLGEG